MSFDSGADYTLKIDFDVFTIVELRSVLKMLYYSSSFCYIDICLMGEYIIHKMDDLGFRLRNRENRGLVELVVEVFEKLKKIKKEIDCNAMIYDIHHKFNHYMYSDLEVSPVASPVKSPMKNAPEIMDPTEEEKVSFPKKMKKAFRRS